MKVCVIGGAGFVGGHVAEALQEAGHDVWLADRAVPDVGRGWRWFECSILGTESVRRAIRGADVVMHLAAVSNTQDALRDPVQTAAVNCMGTAAVLEACRLENVQRCVVAGSTLVSGLQIPHAMQWPSDCYKTVTVDEEHGYTELDPALDALVVDEWSPFDLSQGSHPYVSSKVYTELAALDAANAYGVLVTVLRYGIMYGPRMAPGVLADLFIRAALKGRPLGIQGEGQQWRQYLHVRDLALAHVAVLENWDASLNQVINVCPQRKVTVADMAEAVCKAIPGTTVQYGPPRLNDIPVRFCMAGKAKTLLDWQPEIGLEDGIAHTVEWYRGDQ